MGGVEVRMNPAGIRALLNGPEVRADLQRRVDRIAAATGDPASHTARVDQGGSRLLGIVAADSATARREEAVHRSLAGALDAGR